MDLYTQIKDITKDAMSRKFDMCNDPDLGATLAFADKAHQNQLVTNDLQFRKYMTWLPYMVHPVRVCLIVRAAGGSIAQQQAALLHDVVEDTNTTIEEVYEAFGDDVGLLVAGLTDVSQPMRVKGPSRDERKAMDRAHSIAQGGDTQTCKYADLIDNTADIVMHDRNFARLYLREKALLLDGMDKGCPELRAVAYRFLDEGMLFTMSYEGRKHK